MENKLVVLGIPWDVDSDGLRDYMSKFGKLEDAIVMKERTTGQSRGFGYVTFSSAEEAKNALTSEHILGGRILEVKIATPKEEMRGPSRKVTRIFVAKIPSTVTESVLQVILSLTVRLLIYTCQRIIVQKSHRGIGFITFTSADSVDTLMEETHELGDAMLVVDRANPKDEEYRIPRGISQVGYGAYNAYITAATRYAALGVPTLYDQPVLPYGGRKIFIGRLPPEASVEDLCQYFGNFGHISDAYIPKDPKRTGHRGFGFVTFMENGIAERVTQRPHEILGQQIAVDLATPLSSPGGPEGSFGGHSGPMRSHGKMHESLAYDCGYRSKGRGRPFRTTARYIPY